MSCQLLSEFVFFNYYYYLGKVWQSRRCGERVDPFRWGDGAVSDRRSVCSYTEGRGGNKDRRDERGHLQKPWESPTWEGIYRLANGRAQEGVVC